MNDERDLAIANREKIRKMYNKKPRPKTEKVVVEDPAPSRPEDLPSAPAKPSESKPLFGGW